MKNPDLTPRVIRFGVFKFSPQTGDLRKHGLKVKLVPQASKILLLLLEHPERSARDNNSSPPTMKTTRRTIAPMMSEKSTLCR
jgi:hypothetical protein